VLEQAKWHVLDTIAAMVSPSTTISAGRALISPATSTIPPEMTMRSALMVGSLPEFGVVF
jgi:hypothetical protein